MVDPLELFCIKTLFIAPLARPSVAPFLIPLVRPLVRPLLLPIYLCSPGVEAARELEDKTGIKGSVGKGEPDLDLDLDRDFERDRDRARGLIAETDIESEEMAEV